MFKRVQVWRKRQMNSPLRRATRVVIVIMALIFSGCLQTPVVDGLDPSLFVEYDLPQPSKMFRASTDRTEYLRGEIAYVWFANNTGSDIWFPNTVFGIRAFQQNPEDKIWKVVQLGIFGSDSNPPEKIAPGLSDPKFIPITTRIPVGALRLVFVGSTDQSAPGVGGEVYSTYIDINVR